MKRPGDLLCEVPTPRTLHLLLDKKSHKSSCASSSVWGYRIGSVWAAGLVNTHDKISIATKVNHLPWFQKSHARSDQLDNSVFMWEFPIGLMDNLTPGFFFFFWEKSDLLNIADGVFFSASLPSWASYNENSLQVLRNFFPSCYQFPHVQT